MGFYFIDWATLDLRFPTYLPFLGFQSRNNLRARELAQWLRTLVPLPEDLGSIPTW